MFEKLNKDMTAEQVRLTLGLAKTQSTINLCQKIRMKLNNPEAFCLEPTEELMQQVIKEYKCDYFVFVLKVPNAKYADVAVVPKQTFINNAVRWLYPSTIQPGEQKRNEAGKPCFRFNTANLRAGCKFLVEARLDLEGMTWKQWIKVAQQKGLRNNAGCYAEVQVCEMLGLEQIGEKDRQSHTVHCDGVSLATEKHFEVKLETGYITSQFWTSLNEWAK